MDRPKDPTAFHRSANTSFKTRMGSPLRLCNVSTSKNTSSNADVVLEGGFSCEKAFGKHLFELLATDDEMSKNFNRAMSVYTDLVMNKVLETYKGFEGVSQVVDVGGGVGTNLKLIVSNYPQIKGVNFDLPQVIKDAVPFPGVEHLSGYMFTKIPKAEVIFMKVSF
ncbi:hypothetical protein V6N13_020106 [Hibiscus sabdariffa]